jgi:hypothetical protein
MYVTTHMQRVWYGERVNSTSKVQGRESISSLLVSWHLVASVVKVAFERVCATKVFAAVTAFVQDGRRCMYGLEVSSAVVQTSKGAFAEIAGVAIRSCGRRVCYMRAVYGSPM